MGGLADMFKNRKRIDYVHDADNEENQRRKRESQGIDFVLSIKSQVGDKIEGQGVTSVKIAMSKIGGVSEHDYVKLMGKPADLDKVLSEFADMHFHAARVTLENGWVICINSYDGFIRLEKN